MPDKTTPRPTVAATLGADDYDLLDRLDDGLVHLEGLCSEVSYGMKDPRAKAFADEVSSVVNAYIDRSRELLGLKS